MSNLPQSRVTACHEHHLSLANAQAMPAQSEATSQGTYKISAATHIAGSRLTETTDEKNAKQNPKSEIRCAYNINTYVCTYSSTCLYIRRQIVNLSLSIQGTFLKKNQFAARTFL